MPAGRTLRRPTSSQVEFKRPMMTTIDTIGCDAEWRELGNWIDRLEQEHAMLLRRRMTLVRQCSRGFFRPLLDWLNTTRRTKFNGTLAVYEAEHAWMQHIVGNTPATSPLASSVLERARASDQRPMPELIFPPSFGI